MITVMMDDVATVIESDQLVPWLCGFSGHAPSASAWLRLPASLVGDLEVHVHEVFEGERYHVSIGDVEGTLPAEWVIPWMTGLASRNGVRLSALLDGQINGRMQRFQALMIGHDRGWIMYTGVSGIERTDT